MQRAQCNIEAEHSVLAACLMTSDGIIEAAPILKPEDFYNEENRVIYSTILELFNDRRAVDLLTVGDKLKGKLAPSKIAKIANAPYFIGALSDYIRIIKDFAFTRNFLKLVALYSAKAQAGEFKDVSRFKEEIMEKNPCFR